MVGQSLTCEFIPLFLNSLVGKGTLMTWFWSMKLKGESIGMAPGEAITSEIRETYAVGSTPSPLFLP